MADTSSHRAVPASLNFRLFILLLLAGFTLRAGYGVARYVREGSLALEGIEFIQSWDHDALEHVLIANAIRTGKGHVVDELPGLEGKNIRRGEAVYKAPLYQYFLALVFALGGLSFASLIPVQALVGGALSGFTGLFALETFGSRTVAWIAGLLAAGHPVLVNSASQPYNENLFYCTLMASLWAFLRFFKTERRPWAVTAGVLMALTLLTRESAIALLAVMVLFPAVVGYRRRRLIGGVAVMLLATVAVVLPWPVRNYLRFGEIVPIARVTGTALGIGNSSCLANESLLRPYWAEGPCEESDRRREAAFVQLTPEQRASRIWQDRVYGQVGRDFIFECPVCYVKLTLRRTWTLLLPYHPFQDQDLVQRAGLVAYWLIVMPVGLIGVVRSMRRPQPEIALLILLIVASAGPLIAVYFSPDLRYRVGADILIGCFAATVYAGFLSRVRPRSPATETVTRLGGTSKVAPPGNSNAALRTS
jgi:4-amino-4-deoxy-L-arabinose transferase-like glycosyltransferase